MCMFITQVEQGHSATVWLNNNEQIGNLMTVWLRGGYADPSRHVELGQEGILQFNGAEGSGIRETFRNLVVFGRGVIDFQVGTLASENRLILDNWGVRYNAEGGSVLFVRNWVEFEDRLLVRRSSVTLTASAAAYSLRRLSARSNNTRLRRDLLGGCPCARIKYLRRDFGRTRNRALGEANAQVPQSVLYKGCGFSFVSGALVRTHPQPCLLSTRQVKKWGVSPLYGRHYVGGGLHAVVPTAPPESF